MGLIRKMTSITTFGTVDFRSAKDRTAAHTATMARQSRKQTHLLQRQIRATNRTANYGYVHEFTQAPQLPPAGWYPCPTDPWGSVRYWDGYSWTYGFKQ